MEDFTPHVVVKIPKTNFPRGQRHFELFKRLAAMFQLVPSSIAFCIFSQFWRELGKDFQELICKNRLWLLHFSISSSSCWVIGAQFWALPQILVVTWGKVAYSLSSLVFQSWSPADNASFLLCHVLSTETISSKRGSLLQGGVCSVPTTRLGSHWRLWGYRAPGQDSDKLGFWFKQKFSVLTGHHIHLFCPVVKLTLHLWCHSCSHDNRFMTSM